MSSRIYIVLLIFFQSLICVVHAQQQRTLVDSIADRIELLGAQHPSATLFVHFDKTMYSSNENVWFTGYIIKTNTTGIHHTLCVALIRNDDRSVLAQAKYVMDNGLAMGNMVLPDSLPAGNYSLVCYTNLLVNGYPSALFVQAITIKSGDAKSFIANLSLVDSIRPGMDSAKVLLKAYTKDITLIKKTPVNYFIGDRMHPTHKGSLLTDNFGEATIPVPLKEITPNNNVLQVEMQYGKEIKSFSIRLPVYKKSTLVKFYPEGGHLTAAANCTVAWEVTNNEGEPLQVTAAVYENDQFLQNITTNAYGMGTFVLNADAASRYYVKLTSIVQDSVYLLPKIVSVAPAITVTHGLENDTLLVTVQPQEAGQNLFLLVHDYRTVFFTGAVATAAKKMTVKIPLDQVPRGLATLTMLDSLGRPVAERMFFAHFDKHTTIQLNTDSAVYNERQKVILKLNIADAAHQPVAALVSIACVQNNRVDVLKAMNIENYTCVTHELAAIPFKKELMGNDAASKEFLEQVLLIKGWSRYTWQDVDTVQPAVPVMRSLSFTGHVTYNKKPLKKPVQLNLRRFVDSKLSELEILRTDSSGRFELPPEKLLSEPDKKFEVSVRNDDDQEYVVTVNDTYLTMNKILASSLTFPDYSPRSFTQSSKESILKGNEVVKTLKTVVVTSKKDDSFFGARAAGTNACGDYVCLNGILNCTNHPNDRFQPVVGMSYGVRSSGGSDVHREVYTGCTALTRNNNNQYRFSMEGIYGKKEFYVTDLSNADPTDPQYLSTLYWNHAVQIDKTGTTEISFYTSDITGRFRIVVQGVTTGNVVYGESFFEVKGE